ncbi:kinetochore protein NDC80 [Nematocida minor]|uniref:kinetochore protein NDC80 n=1 Tax=Nematocida minor TaxID=1912983 RepID=UPI00221F308D|nr:kinetochore protein NDC80 [Nematocida minor]KAI5190375.1 kinetochore protein NDC80 [Nematocida minor]
MRRATMAGMPARNSLSADTSRLTLTEDPRRKGRNPRDRAHQEENISTILGFLSSTEYDRPYSHALLSNPSLKDFQSIFRHIQSFLGPYLETTKKFEDEVPAFLKAIKYPFVSEINRSQLIAITPHTWPVLLSMLGWLSRIVSSSYELMTDPGSEKIKSVFYEYLYGEYANYMEGKESTHLQNALEKEVSQKNKEKIRTAEEKKEHLEKIKNKIKAISTNDLPNVLEKQKQTQIDLDKISALRKSQEIKNKNHRKALEEAQRVLNALEEERKQLETKREQLENEIKVQPIRQEDIEEMTEERDALIKTLEEIKRSKTLLIREIDSQNNKIKIEAEESETILSNIKKVQINESINIKIEKIKRNTGLLEYEEYRIDGDIREEEKRIKSILEELQREREAVEAELEKEKERNMALNEIKNNLIEEIEQKEERVKVHAQVYLEKKEATEEEYKMTVGRVDKAETELLKISAEGDNGLFQTEQALERIKIKKGRTISRISVEEAETQKISAIVAANMNSLKERIDEAYGALSI